MSQINVAKEHRVGKNKVREILGSIIEGLAKEYGASYVIEGDKISFKGPWCNRIF